MYFMVQKQAIIQETSSKKLGFSRWLKFFFCARGNLSQKFLNFCKTQSYLYTEDNLYRNSPVCQHLSSTWRPHTGHAIKSAGLEEKDHSPGPAVCPFANTANNAVGLLWLHGHTYRTYFQLFAHLDPEVLSCRPVSAIKQ